MSTIVDYLHISQNEGVEKPDMEFYRSFFKKYDLSIEDSFYVGDNYVLDYLPAIKMGLKTWLLDECGFYPHCHEAINNVSDLLLQIPQ